MAFVLMVLVSAVATLPATARPVAQWTGAPAATDGLRRIRVDAPLGTLVLSVANDDRTNAVLCASDAIVGNNGRITIYPRDAVLPLEGRISSVPRDLVFVGNGGAVVAIIPSAPPNETVGGPPPLRSAGVFARYLIETAPGVTALLNISPGAHLKLPRGLDAASPADVRPPCARSIR